MTRSRAFSAISRLSRERKYLPRSYWIDPETVTLPNEPSAYGGTSDVYRGTWDGEFVAVKVFRTSNQESSAKLKEVSTEGRQESQYANKGRLDGKQRLCKETIVWKHISCSHILKFYGAFYRDHQPVIVTPWMLHGNITEYLEKHADADRLRLVNSNVRQCQAFVHVVPRRWVAFRCCRRSQVPPQL